MATLESPAAASLVEAPASPGGRPAVEVAHLRKSYGTLVAVDDVSFTVAEGEIFGILGPNGAGKTTAIECAIGLRRPDAGTIRLLGLDPHADPHQVHELVGVQLQSGALPAKLRVGEILEEYRSFYRDPADIDDLLDVLGLAAKRGDYYRSLSGGQRQRLSIALALIGRPRIAVLDEMTTGLDPQARRDTWELIEQIRDRGVTIVLVTHFMEEAERLCDRVALIDAGKVVAIDTPAGLAGRVEAGQRIQFRPSVPFDDALLAQLPDVTHVIRRGDVVVVTGNDNALNAVTSVLARHQIVAHQLRVDQASLEDAFLALTGKHSDSE
jgi:ABC-2 type transport system ATP-binding protein